MDWTTQPAALPLAGVYARTEDTSACVAQLPPTGRLMFDAVAPYIRATSDVPTPVREHIRPPVMSGRTAGGDAKQNAKPAGKCLLLLRTEL